MSLENKTVTYNTPLDLVKHFVINEDLHIKYFQNFQLLYTHDGKSPKLIYFENVETYRDVTDLDLMELQIELMLVENINVRNFSILSQALINYLHRYNTSTKYQKVYDFTQNTEEEVLIELIHRHFEKYGYVEVRKLLEDFGLNFTQFKKYDKKLAKLLSTEGFVKSRKTMNKIKYTVYQKSGHSSTDLDTNDTI